MTMSILLAASFQAVAPSPPIGAAVENKALRLIVETSSDLESYSIEAEFQFRTADRDPVVLFHFPGVPAPGALAWLELDGRRVNAPDVTVREHPRLGGEVFALTCGGCAAGSRHVLRVRGPEMNTPAHGFTRWGSWHPYLDGRDLPVRVELEVRTSAENAVLSSGHHVEERLDGHRRISRWQSAYPTGLVFLAIKG